MILIGIGSNLSSPDHGGPRQVCAAALARLERADVRVVARSRWFESAPVPVSDQPWFVNAVAAVETPLSPSALLAGLHGVEATFGRVRRVVNEARVLDLDLLDFGGLLQEGPPVLPHPRLRQRAFVLLPLLDIAPGWRHPGTGEALADLIAALPPGQGIRPAADQD